MYSQIQSNVILGVGGEETRESRLETKELHHPQRVKQWHAYFLRRHPIPSPSPNFLSLLIHHYLSLSLPRHALLLYLHSPAHPDLQRRAALPLALKACSALSRLPLGAALHADALKAAAFAGVMVGTAVVSMYAGLGHAVRARRAFDEMPVRNAVAWNAMVGGYAKNGEMGAAGLLFEAMPEPTPVAWAEMVDGFGKVGDTASARRWFDRVPVGMRNVVTWSVMVEGYARNGEMEAARAVFDDMPVRNCHAWSSMVDGYCKKGDLVEAKKLFEQIPDRNLVNWNALIAGLAHNGFCEQALEAFGRMRGEGLEPDEFTVSSLLSACGQLGCLERGKEIHELIFCYRIKLNEFVLNGLVDMYSKCGDLGKAREIFEGMSCRNEACWNSMISGFASFGESEEAVKLFRRMEASGAKPNEITFIAALSACAHGGLVEDGFKFFQSMENVYGVAAGIEHYGCMVDLLGRVGRLEEAFDLVKKMPMEPNEVVWGSLLGACRIQMNVSMAELVLAAFDGPSEVSNDDRRSLLISNIYAASNRWEEAEKLRLAMAKRGIRKVPGCSSITVGSCDPHIVAGRRISSHTFQICGEA